MSQTQRETDRQARAAAVAAAEAFLAAPHAAHLNGSEREAGFANIKVSFDGGKTMIDLGDHWIEGLPHPPDDLPPPP